MIMLQDVCGKSTIPSKTGPMTREGHGGRSQVGKELDGSKSFDFERHLMPLIHGFIYLLPLGLKGSNVSPFLLSTGYLTVCYVKSSIYQKYIINGPFSSMFHTFSIHVPQFSP